MIVFSIIANRRRLSAILLIRCIGMFAGVIMDSGIAVPTNRLIDFDIPRKFV